MTHSGSRSSWPSTPAWLVLSWRTCASSRGDLKELMELTEAGLVSVRKSKLQAFLDGEHPDQDDAEYLAFQKAITEVVEVPAAPRSFLKERQGQSPPSLGWRRRRRS